MKKSSSALISFLLLLSCLLLPSSAQKPTPKPKPTPKCHPKDQNAIQQIQASLGNNSAQDCCDWEFVSCDYFPPYNHVTSFQAINSSISSQVWAAIFDLSYLGVLEISNAPNLTGNIPPAIGDLSNLVNLEISNAPNLTGNIPPTVSKLSKLVSITITNTRISGTIPTFSVNLTDLDLSHNALTGSIPSKLPSWLPNLRSLALGYNKLTGTIPESFGNLTDEFYSLGLSNNFLTGHIPKSLSNLNLEDIDLSENRFTGDASFLFNANSTTESLSLDITGNDFSFDISKVKVSFKMRVLHMSHNNIFGSLPKDLTQATFLIDFDASHNMLCGKIPVGGMLQQTPISSYADNKCLCGDPLPACVKVNHLLVSNQTSGSSPLPHLRDLCTIISIMLTVLSSIYI